MYRSKWIKSHIGPSILGMFIVLAGISMPSFYFNQHPPTQRIKPEGARKITVEIGDSSGPSVPLPEIDAQELAGKLAGHLPDQQTVNEQDAEARVLQAAIERLLLDSADESRQKALQALTNDNTPKAIELLEKAALSGTEQAEQLAGQAASDWLDVGNIAFLSDSQKALHAFQEAARLHPASLSLADWQRLGHLFERLGRLDEARQAFEYVLKLAGENTAVQAVASNQLGNLYQNRGELDKAEELYRQSLDLEKSLGQQEETARTHGNLGLVYQSRGELDRAEEYYLQSLEIERSLGRQEGMASNYGNLGLVYQSRGELDKAEAFHRRSLDIEKSLGHRAGMASDYGNLGLVYQTRGQLDKAEAFHRQSLDIEKSLGRQEGMACDFGNLGLVYQSRGELDKACDYWRQSSDSFASAGAKEQIHQVGSLIAEYCAAEH
jgi:protein O-GlcNAc transferase